MEAAGLAVGAIALSVRLIQSTDKIINTLDRWKERPIELTQLADELKLLKNGFLVVRDSIEREANDDGKIEVLSILTRKIGEFTGMLDDLEFLLARILRGWRLGRLRHRGVIESIQERRLSLDIFLLSNELAPTTSTALSDPTKSKTSYRIRPSIVAEWLDELRYTEVLEDLAAQYKAETGAWLLDNSLFLEWEENPGRALWCSGVRE